MVYQSSSHITPSEWRFDTELILRDFLISNLQELLGLDFIAKEFLIDERCRCDILAVNALKQAVIIELKNAEDPTVVSQLKRYESALLQKKPFQERIDYQQAVLLVAVAPTFDLETRRWKSACELRQFKIVSELFSFELKNLNTGSSRSVCISPKWNIRLIPAHAPKGMNKILKSCLKADRFLIKKRIIQIRNKVLAFDHRVQEVGANSGVKYGRDRQFCLELYFDEIQPPAIILTLPRFSGERSTGRLAKMRIWADWKWDKAVIVRPVRIALGRISSSDIALAEQTIRRRGCSLDELIDLALNEWANRL